MNLFHCPSHMGDFLRSGNSWRKFLEANQIGPPTFGTKQVRQQWTSKTSDELHNSMWSVIQVPSSLAVTNTYYLLPMLMPKNCFLFESWQPEYVLPAACTLRASNIFGKSKMVEGSVTHHSSIFCTGSYTRDPHSCLDTLTAMFCRSIIVIQYGLLSCRRWLLIGWVLHCPSLSTFNIATTSFPRATYALLNFLFLLWTL